MTASADTATSICADVAARPSERSQRPWIALGISERTYHRRKASFAKLAASAAPLPQHADHVVVWLKQLGSFDRLDFLAWARRCGNEARRAA